MKPKNVLMIDISSIQSYQPYSADSNIFLCRICDAMIFPFIGYVSGAVLFVTENQTLKSLSKTFEYSTIGLISGLKCGIVSTITDYFIKDANIKTELLANIAINGILAAIGYVYLEQLPHMALGFGLASLYDVVLLTIDNYFYNQNSIQNEINYSSLENFQDTDVILP